MRKLIYYFTYCKVFYLCFVPSTEAQIKNSAYGSDLPVHDTIRVLIVFAETDCSTCNCDVSPDASSSAWVAGQMPDAAANATAFQNQWFDPSLSAGQQPTSGNLTDYYYQMSLGQYVVLGDYYPELITVPCTANNRVNAVVDSINKYTLANGSFITQSGLTLADFDHWKEDGKGIQKTKAANGKIDAIAYIWRNFDYIYDKCSGGLAIMACQAGSNTLKQDAITSYTTCIGGSFRSCDGNIGIFQAEFFHALFGGNNWHSGGGAGAHTFLAYPNNYSISSYSFAGKVACGYDRQRLGWYGWKDNNKTSRKDSLISAVEPSTGLESWSDLDIQTSPDSATFILRDFIAYGDAIRIKLPHFNWQSNVDIKNQYLWLENHQKISGWDKSNWEPACGTWIPGLYAYIQVGKDLNNGTNIYSTSADHPNGLGSWLMPVSAEGNFDYKYLKDSAGTSWDDCVWNGKYLPKDKYSSGTKPNPFTGMSDLFEIVDYNDNGILKDGDDYQPWTAEIINGNIEFTGYASGDAYDAFTLSGNNKLALYTNPAPMPVYTYRSNSYPNVIDGEPQLGNYENRTTWLNGLSIEITDSIPNATTGGYDIKVKIKWDDYNIKEHVWWKGNIVLQNDTLDPYSRQSQLNVAEGKTIFLERSRSATQHIAEADGFFSKPTRLTLRSGTKTYLDKNACIVIREGSELVLEDGSEMYLADSALIRIDSGSTLTLKGNDITLAGPDSRIVINPGGVIKTADGVNFTFSGAGYLEIHENGLIKLGAESYFYLHGSGPSKRMMVLKEGANPDIGSHHLILKNGKILYGANAGIQVSDSTLNVRDCRFEATGGGAVGIRGDSLHRVSLSSSVFLGFEYGIALSGADSALGYTYIILLSRFVDNLIGIRLEGIKRKVAVLSTDFTGPNTTGTGIFAEDCPLIEYSTGRVVNQDYGLRLKNVEAMYLNNVSVDSCFWGVRADTSNIFLRKESIIKNCTTGIELYGSTGDGNLVAVGDIDCAHIMNCTTGIEGTNVILKIDAKLNACARGDCDDLVPNRFDGNDQYFSICYQDTIVDTIYGRYNFWGLDGSGYGIPPDAADYSLTNSYPNKPCKKEINFTTSHYQDTIPEDCWASSIVSPASLTESELEDATLCDATLSIGAGRLMSEDFLNGYGYFMDTNWVQAKNLLEDVAAENIETASLDAGCEQCVRISRVLVDVISVHQAYDTLSLVAHKTNTKERTEQKKALSSRSLQLFPNPAEEWVRVVFEGKKAAGLVIINLSGMEVHRQQIYSGEQVDLSAIPAGVYLVQLHPGDTGEMESTRLVLVK